jgi:hypothetical protein
MVPTIEISVYALASLTATTANFIFAVFVLLKNPSSRINQLWALTISTICAWGVSEFILRITQDAVTAEIVGRFGGMAFCFLPAPFLHFTLEFTNRQKFARKWMMYIYSFGILLSLFHLGGFVTKIIHLPWGFTFSPFLLYIPFILWLESCFVLGIYWCLKKYHTAQSQRERKQTLLIILGAMIPLFIGSMTDAFLPLFGMEVLRLAIVTTTATVALVSIGVVKYQLMSLTPETTASIILDTMVDLVIVTDSQGNVRFANNAFRYTLGYDVNHVRVEYFIDDANVLKEALNTSVPQKYETTYRRKDGTKFPVSLSVNCIIDKQELVGIIFVAIDISNLIAVEEKLRESEGMFRALSEASPASIFVYQDEKFKYVNKGTEIVSGYSHDELMAMKFSHLIHPDFREMVKERAAARLRGENITHRYEFKIIRNDGEIRWLDFAGARIELNGNAAGIGLAFDITEQKIANDQLKEQATLLNKASDAIIVIDIDEKIRFWNPSAEQLYGWKASAVIGQKIRDVIRTNDKEKFTNAWESVFTNSEWNGEMMQLNHQDKEITVASRWTLINDVDLHPKSILMLNTDITEKKAFETQFLRKQRLESLGTLASGIAHDLNNILAPIIVGIGIIRKILKGDKKKVFDVMELSAKRGAALVHQILAFASGATSERTIIHLKYQLLEMKKIIQETFPKSITIQINVPYNIYSIAIEEVQLHQILLNLCVNARDAMPNGGLLSIAAENVELDEVFVANHNNAQKGPFVRLTVTDTGTGILPAVVDKIFDPFFTTKEIGHGTGLGLSTVNSIVKNHGGFLEVESKLEVGTKFFVYFPAIRDEHSKDLPMSTKEISLGNNKMILVADDESSIIEIVRETLEVHQYTVVTATNGKEAVDVFTQHKQTIEAIVIDLGMPLMDGITAIRSIKALRNDAKIIAVTGNSPTITKFNLEAFGANAFLQKPFSSHELLYTLHTVLNENRDSELVLPKRDNPI